MIKSIKLAVPPRDRNNNYAGAKVAARKNRLILSGYGKSELLVLGEREYSANGSFVEPSARWDNLIRTHTGYNGPNGDRKIVVLGVSRKPSLDGAYAVKFVQVGEPEDWEKFKASHKVLLLGMYFKQSA